jgi:sterol desaturase/sphingolipid hydroxylase (fatty acid hydroxylase superfamily)
MFDFLFVPASGDATQKVGIFYAILLVLSAAEATIIIYGLRRHYSLKENMASFGVAIGNALTRPLLRVVLSFVFGLVTPYALFQMPTDKAWAWGVGFVAVEFTYYWLHRFGHTVRWMWANHSVHHTASQITLPAAIRLGWTNIIAGEWLLFIPVILLGVPPVMIAVLLSLNLIYQFFLHTETSPRWGVLEWVLNTPAHHRVHHASNPAYLDKNFGGVLIIFDRIFGTFAEKKPDERLQYGLTKPLNSLNPFVIAFAEWSRMFKAAKRSRSLKALGAVLFGRP